MNDKESQETMRDEERLHELEREELAIETGVHNGFRDSTRLTKLRVEIEGLDKELRHEKEKMKMDGV